MNPYLEPAASIHPSARVAETAIIGAPYRPLQTGAAYEFGRARIQRGVFIGHHVIIGRGSMVGKGTIIDDQVKIECGVLVGANCIVQYRAYISNEARIGNDCIIAGFVTERVRIGKRCRIFGSIVHRHTDPSRPWDADASQEASATIGDDVFIGFGAVVVGEVTIESGAYIAANSVVTRNVPKHARVTGVNQHGRKELS